MLKRFRVKLVAYTSSPDSDLARNADFALYYRVPREACPLELAPTASTTAALALGDALAMVLMKARGLTREDFAKYHPAGNLGRILLLRVKDIMTEKPVCGSPEDSLESLRATMNKDHIRYLPVKEGDKLLGVISFHEVANAVIRETTFHNRLLKSYIKNWPEEPVTRES
jgi:hypothetical protein